MQLTDLPDGLLARAANGEGATELQRRREVAQEAEERRRAREADRQARQWVRGLEDELLAELADSSAHRGSGGEFNSKWRDAALPWGAIASKREATELAQVELERRRAAAQPAARAPARPRPSRKAIVGLAIAAFAIFS